MWRAYLQRVASIGLSIDHLHDVLIHRLATLVAVTPVICRPHTILADVEVLGVVDVSVWASLDGIQDLLRT